MGRPKRVHRHYSRWTPEEVRKLDRLWGVYSVRAIAWRLGRTIVAVYRRASDLGLGRVTRGVLTMAAYCLSRGHTEGRVKNAAARLGLLLRRANAGRTHHAGQGVPFEIAEEQAQALDEFFAVYPDGAYICNNPKRERGGGKWGVRGRPAACVDHGGSERSFWALGMCRRCYGKHQARKWRQKVKEEQCAA